MSEEDFVFDEIEPDERENEKRFAAPGCRGCFNWLFVLIILGFLIALLWPIKEPPKKKRVSQRAVEYQVDKKVKAVVLDKQKLARLKLKRSFHGNYVLLQLALKNGKTKIRGLDPENFKLIVKRGKVTKEVMVFPATMELKGSYWGKAVLPEQKLNLSLLFLAPVEAKITALRVYDPSWRSNESKDITITL